MSALGIPLLVFLGICLLIGGGAQAKEDFTVRPNLPSRCYKAPDTHMCDRRVAFRWYYDLFTDSCKVFPYRGCPNPNSFATRKDCIEQCLRASVEGKSQRPVEEKDAHNSYRNPEGKSARVPVYRSSDNSDHHEGNVLNHPSDHGRRQRKSEVNEHEVQEDEIDEHVLDDQGYTVYDRPNEHSHHSRRPRSYFPYEEPREHHKYKNHRTRTQQYTHDAQYVPKEKYASDRYGGHQKHRDSSLTPRRYATYEPRVEQNRHQREEHDHQTHYHHERPEHEIDERDSYWHEDQNTNDQYVDLELTGINYDEKKHQVHNHGSYRRRDREHKPNLYEHDTHHKDLYDTDHHQAELDHRSRNRHAEHGMGHIEPRHAGRKGQGRDRHGYYYHYEEPDHPAGSPREEYYYGRHDSRPDGTPPNMYIYGEGPVHPAEVPKELQDYDPDRDDEDIQPVSKEYDSPQDGRQERKKPFVRESGYAPRPLTGHFPGIPTDAALRRFRLRSGWVIEIIPGGFRAVKDERHLNGWRHVYARIYREAPDGSAGRSIWMFQSEYEPPKDDHSPPQEYLQHVTNKNNRQHHHQHHRGKRHVTHSGKSEHWFSSTSSSSFTSERPPVPWEAANHAEPHEEFYREPLANSHFREEPRRSPFTHSMNHNSNVEQRQPMEGRSLYLNLNFHSPRQPEHDYNPRHEGQNNGFPPRDVKNVPHIRAYQRNGARDMLDSPRGRDENNVKFNYKIHTESRPEGRNQEEMIPKKDLETPLNSMTDEEIFDKFRLSKEKPEGSQESKEQREDQEPENSGFEEGAGSESGSSEEYANPDDAPQCVQFPETGPCRAYIRRWYFDPRKQECFTFIYGGCEGNKNSFKTKEECKRTCTGSVKEEPEKPEVSKQSQPAGRYMGLRRQSRKQQPLPVMITTTKSNEKPEVTSAPQLMPEAKNAKKEEDNSQENNSSGEEEEQDVSEEKIDQSNEEGDILPRVINHYHTYHNYGPQHTNHGDFQPRPASSGEKSSSEEEDKEKEENPRMKKNKKRKGNSKMPAPFNMFYKFLKRLRPGSSKNNSKRPDDMEVKSKRTKQGGITLVKFLITKRRRQQDNMNPFSSLLSFGMPPRSSPFTLFFGRPEPKQSSPFMAPQHHLPYNNGPSYQNGPPPSDRRPHFNNEPPHYNSGPHYDNRPPYNNRPYLQGPSNYHQDPEPSDMSHPFRPTLFSPMENLLSPITRLLFPMSPFASRKPIAQPGEKNLGCTQPVNPGPCTHRPGFVRWYYDAQKGDCDIFYYTGCGGNNNKFETLKQCHDVCMVKTPAPPTVAPGLRSNGDNTRELETNELPQEPEQVEPEQIEAVPIGPEQPEPEQIELEQPEPQVDEVPVLPEVEQPEQALVVNAEPQVRQEDTIKEDQEVEDQVEDKTKVSETVEEKKTEKKEEENEVVVKQHLVHSGPVVHTFEFANMHLDTRMEYVLVVVIMILGGAALIVLVAITAYFMYKKHKLATRGPKETTIQKVFHAHAYPEVHKISVIELPRELAGVHDVALK